MNHRNPDLFQELNERAWSLADQAESLGLEMKIQSFVDETGARILDFGTQRTGTLSAGLSLAMICLADLADVQLILPVANDLPLPQVQVITDHPLAACMASQYAGWPLSHGDYFAMCSGPARMARGQEQLLTDYGLEQSMDRVVGILETSEFPPSDVIRHFARECCVEPERVLLCLARTRSLPGSLQVVARSIETTLHKLYELGIDLRRVESAIGTAPLPPIAKDDLHALGWTNDAILYGAQVQLWIDADDSAIESIGMRLPSVSSSEFGTPFLEIFERYDRDFYKIDKMLFSPACVLLNSLQSGRSFLFGSVRNDILKASFGVG
jgi:methenyltetrahydromethanopterin cyclohydrolase